MTPTRPAPLRSSGPIVRSRLRAERRAGPAAIATLAFVAGALAAPTAAVAADDEFMPWYFEFQAGSSTIPNQTLRDGSTGQGRIETDQERNAFNVGAALGRHLTDLFRAEVALTYRQADVKRAGIGARAPAVEADGDVGLLSFMFNGYADLDLDELGLPIIPFLGFGIGFGEVQFDVRQPSPGLDVDDTDIVFVYNAMAGLRIPVNDIVEFSTTYRYVATPDVDNVTSSVDPGTGPAPETLRAEFDAHEVVFGLRYRF